jgi:hypothetical protein
MSFDNPGTIEQQQAVRNVMAVEFGSPQHQWLKRLDKFLNAERGRSYLPIAFVDTDPWLGRAGTTGINLSWRLVPEGIRWVLPHECGHVHDQCFLDQLTKDWFMLKVSGQSGNWATEYQETFADAFRDWWLGTGWQELTPILLEAA